MTGNFLLDWAIMAVSLFNTILLLWLGLTVLLNAERRASWGIWLASGGLLMGGAFFISHSAILGHRINYWSQSLDFWWRMGWIPIAALPFAWYAIILWFAGYWRATVSAGAERSALTRWHRPGFLFTASLAAGIIALLVFANPLPSFTQVAQLDLAATTSVLGVPLLILIYPPYIVLCIGLSLDALRHPGPSGRVMGDLARSRARPWLIAASVALLLASLLVALVMVRVVWNARIQRGYVVSSGTAVSIGRSDLAIAGLIAVATVALGQAVVSYEIFTGKTLPRRGLRRYWRNAVVLAAGYGVVVGWSLTYQLRAIYTLLLSALLMTLFYALLSWRSYVERERYIAHLRPFVASQRLYEHLVTASPSAPPIVDAATPFRALCEDVLDAQTAYLVAQGPLAPLVNPPLAYPDSAPPPLPALTKVTDQFHSPQTMCLSVDPADYGGATWAVPLWSERGLIGVLLLGDKRDGGLYTQEEIEIARASGERLIDTQASTEIARRLMALQRQRLAESQVLDHRARRALHDEILPRLHTAMLTLNDSSEDALALLADVHRQISDLLHEMPTASTPEVARLGLFGALQQAVDKEFGDAFDRVTWRVEPEVEQMAARIPSLTAEVLFYAAREAVRNVACHARDPQGSRPLYLDVFVTWRDGLQIFIEDNGVGLRAAGPSDGGSGQGLALHSTMMAVVGGSLAIESVPDTYTRVTLTLPVSERG